MSPHLPEIRLRPVTEADLGMFRRFVVEPGRTGRGSAPDTTQARRRGVGRRLVPRERY